MLNSHFRVTSPTDAGAISRLMQLAFGISRDSPLLGAEYMDWKYWRPHPEWEGSRSFALEREGNIVAHAAVIPLRCAWGSRRLKMVHMIDVVARPKAQMPLIALMKNVARLAEGWFASGGSDIANKFLPMVGFQESARATMFALPLRPAARLRGEPIDSWRPVARFARDILWKMQAAYNPAKGWGARKISAANLAIEPFPVPHPTVETAVFERSVPAIALLFECPLTPVEFYLVERQGSVCGYFILTLAISQCRIADAWMESNRAQDWRALYKLAVRTAMAHPGVVELVTMAVTEGPAARALAEVGFRRRGQIALRFRIPNLNPPANVHFQMVDGDAAVLHDADRTQFWT